MVLVQGHCNLLQGPKEVHHTLWLGLVLEQEHHTWEMGQVKLQVHPMDRQIEGAVVEQMLEARCCKGYDVCQVLHVSTTKNKSVHSLTHKIVAVLVLQKCLDLVAEHRELLHQVPCKWFVRVLSLRA